MVFVQKRRLSIFSHLLIMGRGHKIDLTIVTNIKILR